MTEENQTQNVASEVQSSNEEATQGATLGVSDLSNAAQVIDIAVQRGAFRANEVAQVGQVYNKLSAFVSSIQAQQEAQAEATAETQ